jgi:hypothetical protein
MQALCATNDFVQSMISCGAVLIMLALIVGHPDVNPAIQGRQGLCTFTITLGICIHSPPPR